MTKNRSGVVAIVFALVACASILLASPQILSAQSSGLRVLASDGIKPVVNALLPKIEQDSGLHVAASFNASKTLEQEIKAGNAFDVAILTTNNIDELIAAGKILPNSKVEIAGAGIGVGIRAGAPKPDISTMEGFKQALLKAKAITFNPSGASSTIFKQIVQRLGISAQVTPKFILDSGPGRPQMLVAQGKADIVITLIPEVLDSKGIELAGPLPKEVQTYFNFAAGISPKSSNPEKSKALIKAMTGPSAAATIKSVGMEPR